MKIRIQIHGEFILDADLAGKVLEQAVILEQLGGYGGPYKVSDSVPSVTIMNDEDVPAPDNKENEQKCIKAVEAAFDKSNSERIAAEKKLGIELKFHELKGQARSMGYKDAELRALLEAHHYLPTFKLEPKKK